MKLKILKSVKVQGIIRPVSLFDNKYNTIINKNKLPMWKFNLIEKDKIDDLNLLESPLEIILEFKNGDILIIKTKAGILTDWASVPMSMRWIADPNHKYVRLASLVHDCLYYEECSELTFRQVQYVFRDLMILAGARRTWAAKYWLATRFFSRRLYRRDCNLDILMQDYIDYEYTRAGN